MTTGTMTMVGNWLYYTIPILLAGRLCWHWWKWGRVGNLVRVSCYAWLLSASWNIPLGLAGTRYQTLLADNPLGLGLSIVRSGWDACYWVTGLWLVVPRGISHRPPKYPQITYLVTQLTGKFVLEFIGNGHQYLYRTGAWWNPTLFTLDQVSYPVLPYLLWLVGSWLLYQLAIRRVPLVTQGIKLPIHIYLDYSSESSDSETDYRDQMVDQSP